MNLFEKIKLARLVNKIRKQAMWEKMQSRKLWVTVITATITALSDQLGIDPDLISKLITLAMTYIGGQGVVDAAKALKKDK